MEFLVTMTTHVPDGTPTEAVDEVRAREGALADALLKRDGLPLHLAGHLRAEEWNGTVSAGFFISDAAVA